MFENIGQGLEQLGIQADAIEEQQSKRTQSGTATQSGSSSRSGHNWRVVEADASGEQLAVEADVSGEQLAVEADASGEQLAVEADRCNRGAVALHRELSGAGLLT